MVLLGEIRPIYERSVRYNLLYCAACTHLHQLVSASCASSEGLRYFGVPNPQGRSFAKLDLGLERGRTGSKLALTLANTSNETISVGGYL